MLAFIKSPHNSNEMPVIAGGEEIETVAAEKNGQRQADSNGEHLDHDYQEKSNRVGGPTRNRQRGEQANSNDDEQADERQKDQHQGGKNDADRDQLREDRDG